MASDLSKLIADDLFEDGAMKRSAKRLVLEMPGESFRGSGWSKLPLADRIDRALQEVREVLAGTRTDYYDDHPCWCQVEVRRGTDIQHTDICQRARALSERLEVK